MGFTGIARPGEFRTVTRAHVIAPARKLPFVFLGEAGAVGGRVRPEPSVLRGHGAINRISIAFARSTRIAGTCLVRLMASMLSRAVR
jgi:hypothetical protein